MSVQARSLDDLLDELGGLARDTPHVSFDQVMECVGERSFGPVLVIAGLAALTPISIIPGLPTAFALLVLLIAGQLVAGRHTPWIPGFVRRRKVKGERFRRSVDASHRIARIVDRLLRPNRMGYLAGRTATRVSAVACCAMAASIPPLELVPMGVMAPATAITAFGLGLTARDGLFVLLAFLASLAAVGLMVWGLFLR